MQLHGHYGPLQHYKFLTDSKVGTLRCLTAKQTAPWLLGQYWSGTSPCWRSQSQSRINQTQLNKTKFLPELSFSADRLSYGVRTAPTVCNHIHQRLCALEKSQTLAAIPLSGHTKMLHTLVAMGSAALTAAVPYTGKATRISRIWRRS